MRQPVGLRHRRVRILRIRRIVRVGRLRRLSLNLASPSRSAIRPASVPRSPNARHRIHRFSRYASRSIYSPPDRTSFSAGTLSAAAGRAAYDTIVRAVADAADGAVQAIATAPINKEAFRLAGLPWAGHTDLLAHLTGAKQVAMMFESDALRVVLATVHIPLSEVPAAPSRARVSKARSA